ncbi:MAG TPA: hypothetical protein VHK47_22520 [Polyangia bacterium]|jgi:hypothetical protein|nr:hypothetical protein [Polyangia bacterium]
MTMSSFDAKLMRLALGAAVLVAAAGAGCGKKTGAAPGTAHAEGTPQTDAVLDAWKSAGLKPEGFAALTPPPYVATYCERGKVSGVDTTVCEYADDGAVDRGQQQIKDEWARAGVHTAVVVRGKRTVLSVVDRELRDPNGKTINQLIQTFRKL